VSRNHCYTVGVLVTRDISVRPYQPEDDEFIARVAREAFLEFTPRAVQHTLDMARHFRTLLALQGEVRVGFITFSGRSGDVYVVQAIAVSKGQRGRGIGHRLMLAFETLARAEGALRFELCTADCNLAALDLFLKRGFRISRRRERFYERGQAACILVKDASG